MWETPFEKIYPIPCGEYLAVAWPGIGMGMGMQMGLGMSMQMDMQMGMQTSMQIGNDMSMRLTEIISIASVTLEGCEGCRGCELSWLQRRSCSNLQHTLIMQFDCHFPIIYDLSPIILGTDMCSVIIPTLAVLYTNTQTRPS